MTEIDDAFAWGVEQARAGGVTEAIFDALTAEDITEAAWQACEAFGYVIMPMTIMWMEKHIRDNVLPRLIAECATASSKSSTL